MHRSWQQQQQQRVQWPQQPGGLVAWRCPATGGADSSLALQPAVPMTKQVRIPIKMCLEIWFVICPEMSYPTVLLQARPT